MLPLPALASIRLTSMGLPIQEGGADADGEFLPPPSDAVGQRLSSAVIDDAEVAGRGAALSRGSGNGVPDGGEERAESTGVLLQHAQLALVRDTSIAMPPPPPSEKSEPLRKRGAAVVPPFSAASDSPPTAGVFPTAAASSESFLDVGGHGAAAKRQRTDSNVSAASETAVMAFLSSTARMHAQSAQPHHPPTATATATRSGVEGGDAAVA